MALKFLNKKGWHTGSLRNIENVWKAEQKHEAEQRKLEELKKQIHEERERDEFRQLQEQAGFAPRQERLEFLYDSGLAVGKSSSDGFKALEPPRAEASASASGSAAPDSSQPSAPGALFEEKPQSANDAWRKLHSDPLLMIRQREQDALARIKNNPVKMAMIRKSVEVKKKDDEAVDKEHKKVKSKHKKHSSSKYHSDLEDDSHEEKERRKKAKHKKKEHLDSDEDLRERTRLHKHSRRDNESERQPHSSSMKQKADRSEEDSKDRTRNHRHSSRDYESERQQRSSPVKQKADRHEEDSKDRTRHHRHSSRDYESGKQRHSSPSLQKAERSEDLERSKRSYEKSKYEEHHLDHHTDKSVQKARDNGNSRQANDCKYSAMPPRPDSHRRRGKATQLTEEERAARLREMQMDAEVHEEQRWKRLKKADEDDALEASRASTGTSRGGSFLDAVQKSVYGAEKGGSSTIEESVRRRSQFRQGRTEGDERNAFRR